MTKEEFSKYYNFPLLDTSIAAIDNCGRKIFDRCKFNGYDEFYKKIINALNGEVVKIGKTRHFTHDGLYIYIDGKTGPVSILKMRGWGHLTGVGGLHLPPEEAEEVMKGILDYCCESLNNNIRYNRFYVK